jgi:hypothetical protein
MTSLRLRLFAPSFCIARIRRLSVARLAARHPLKVVAAAAPRRQLGARDKQRPRSAIVRATLDQ